MYVYISKRYSKGMNKSECFGEITLSINRYKKGCNVLLAYSIFSSAVLRGLL